MTFRSATCPSCGGDLQIPDDRIVVKCMYCGSDIIVQEVLGKSISQEYQNCLFLAKEYMKRRDYKKSQEYYNKALELNSQDPHIWFLKGKFEAKIWSNRVSFFDLELIKDEMFSDFSKAIECSNDADKFECKQRIVNEMHQILSIEDKRDQLDSIKNNTITPILDFILEIDPNDLVALKKIVIIISEMLRTNHFTGWDLWFKKKNYPENVKREIMKDYVNIRKKDYTESLEIYIGRIIKQDPDYEAPKIPK